MLNLSFNVFGTKDACQALAELIKVNSTIAELDISSCQISGMGATLIFDALKENLGIVYLNLERNGLQEVAFHLCEALACNIALKHLNVADCILGAEVVGNWVLLNKTLKTIILSGNNIKGSAAKLLAQSQSLTHINLSGNSHLDSDVVVELLTHNRQLKNLNATYCKFDPLQLIAITNALKHHPWFLSEFNLFEDEALDENVVDAIRNAVRQNGSLIYGGSEEFTRSAARNKAMHSRAKMSSIILLAIRRHKRSSSSSGELPKELVQTFIASKEMVKMIASTLWNTRCDVQGWNKQ